MNSPQVNSTQIKKGRKSLILLLLAFIIPVVLAKLALEQQWFNYGVTNKGDLLTNELTLADLGLSVDNYDHKWLLLYVIPESCDQGCLSSIHSLENTYRAIGKDIPRVTSVLLAPESVMSSLSEQEISSKWQVENGNDMVKTLIPTAKVLIVDTLGNVVLMHTPPATNDELAAFGKAIVADFQKLLKYSRIG